MPLDTHYDANTEHSLCLFYTLSSQFTLRWLSTLKSWCESTVCPNSTQILCELEFQNIQGPTAFLLHSESVICNFCQENIEQKMKTKMNNDGFLLKENYICRPKGFCSRFMPLPHRDKEGGLWRCAHNVQFSPNPSVFSMEQMTL